MDALAGLLSGPRARGAFLLRSVLTPPWSIRIEDRAPLTLLIPISGTAWVVPDPSPSPDAAPGPVPPPAPGLPVLLRPGDVAVTRGPAPYTVADSPDTPPSVVIHPDQTSTTLDGEELCAERDQGVRTWGETPDGPTVLVSGTYQLRGEVSRSLLDALPPLLSLSLDSPLTTLLGEEVGRDRPGQDAVLDRLLDLLLISTLRAWFDRPDSDAPPWYRAHTDPVVGQALRLLHSDLARPWTVAGLASATGVSRAALARRFTDLVGESPMAYLTTRRLALAADLLHDPATTLATVARQVGYSTPFALSAAFKRVHGVSPTAHRTT
ncbi:AraC family transcriptional regulator [Kitasatospora sp. NPDC096147]|uniref:AraC family transcriptional regulator n=1 Tax=Kitasatospora sp. NPDC096147 TaxID=3364093 RepID=UPI0037F60EE2